MTRLILIELEEPPTADGLAQAVAVHELPTTEKLAEELGRIAVQEWTLNNQAGVNSYHECLIKTGKAILAAIKGGKQS